MKILACLLISLLTAFSSFSQPEKLIYYDIKTDANGNILPWSYDEPGKAWSHAVMLTWNFWDTMRADMNGIPYYMNHQVWKEGVNDARGLGGDQLSMALSSWQLLYSYTGNERVKENMRFMADYYLTHSLSPANAVWASIPYPYNTIIYSGNYDGDMVIGKGFTQPDKAGAFGWELLKLYKMVSRERFPNKSDEHYLEAAITIANTLAKNTKDGDYDNSPLPFKVNAVTGRIGVLHNNNRDGKVTGLSAYTTNWAGTLELFTGLQQLNAGNTKLYKTAFDKILTWIKKYPLKNNRWGPFFEDVPGWSDTQINAITFAQFMMNHPGLFPQWKKDVKEIFDWVYDKLGNDTWKKYGVTVVNEQTAYQVPGNSHTSRQASAELQYMALTGDRYHYDNAVRQLSWATYMVDGDGKNRYPQDDIWLTDGYGDYIRHFLRAMATVPQLAPTDEEHILSSTSTIQQADYTGTQKFSTHELGDIDPETVKLSYRTYDSSGTETIRLIQKPPVVYFDHKAAKESTEPTSEGYTWTAYEKGGLLTVRRIKTIRVIVGK